jgi:hypothetical protein
VYNSLFSNQNSNLVKVAGPEGQGIYSVSKKGSNFNAQFINRATAFVHVKLAGPKGEGIVARVSQGTAAAGRFETGKIGKGKRSSGSFVELSKGGGRGILSVTGNGQSSHWNTIIQHGVGKKKATVLRMGGKKGLAIHSLTECRHMQTWNSFFENDGMGKPKVKLAHTSGQGIYSYTSSEQNKVYNAVFKNSKMSTVSLAHANGVGINSYSKKQNRYNAQFGNMKHSRVYLAHGEGFALLSKVFGNSWNAKFVNRKVAEVKLANWDGVAMHASNNYRSRSFAGKFESKNRQNRAAALVQLAHPDGKGLWAQTFDKKGYAAKFSFDKTVQAYLGGGSRALDVAVRTDAFSSRFQAGAKKGSAKDYTVAVELSKATGEGIRSVTNGNAKIWNTEIVHRNGGRISLAHGSGQGIRSETRNGDVANAEFSHSGKTFVKLGSPDGLALHSTSRSGSKYNAQFMHGQSSSLQVAGPSGQAIHSTTFQGNTWNAKFEDKTKHGAKTSLHVVHTDGTSIKSSTAGGTKFNAEFRHLAKSFVRLSHGSGLAIDSVTHHNPGNRISSPPQLGVKPTLRPPVRVNAPKGKSKRRGREFAAEETLIQTTEGAEQGSTSVRGSYNARFLHEGRSSLQVAHSSGTVIQARSLAGSGSIATFERGDGERSQRVTLGHASGTPLIAETRAERGWATKFSSAKARVYLAGPDALIHADTRQNLNPKNAKRQIAVFRNAAINVLQLRNDGRVQIGEKRKGYLHVSGNARIDGSLHTIHKGRSVNVAEALERVASENVELKRMVQEMAQQNAMLHQRLSMLETKA